MSHQRAIKKALMRGKGFDTTDVQILTTPAGNKYGVRRVSTLGWYKLQALVAGRRKK
jgi:hypothetical protein